MRGIFAEAENWLDSPCSRLEAADKVAERELRIRRREAVMREYISNEGGQGVPAIGD